MRTAVLFCILLLLAGSVAGCGTRPKAPALRDDPIYQNDREGFRFVVPQGWKQYARADVPPGRAEKERLLVEYKRTATSGALLSVSLIDLPSSADAASLPAGPSYGVERWRTTSAGESITIGGVAAMRYAFTGRVGRDNWTKEVVVVRRGERVYYFTGLFPADDSAAREQVRGAVASVVWKK